MDPTNSVLEVIRLAVGLSKDTTDFDTDLLIHINSAIGAMYQNGVGNNILVTDESTVWEDLIDTTSDSFKMAPSFIMLNVKLLFDPPPPSAIQYHQSNIDQLLWRMKIAEETKPIA